MLERETDRQREVGEKERYIFVYMYGGKGWQWVSSFLAFHLVCVCVFVCFLIFGIRFLTAPELTHTAGQRAYGDSPVSASPSLGL